MSDGPWIVFTDLDGTLLDAQTYDCRPASLALAELAARAIPVVFCTSKTRAESEFLQHQIGVSGPLIVESGGAIWIDGEIVVLGVRYAEVLDRFRELKALVGGAIRGFADLTDAELAQLTGLPPDQAVLARQREYEEPFFFLHDQEVLAGRICSEAEQMGLRVTRGGRFWHLHGPTDKGRAVRHLLQRYPGHRSIGLGDSALDLPMLQVADWAVVVARPDGTHDPILQTHLPNSYRTRAPGPFGWTEAIGVLVFGRAH